MKPIPPLIVKDGHIVAATAPARKSLRLGLSALAALLAAGMGGYWLGQTGSALEARPESTALQSAVTEAMQSAQAVDEEEQRFVLAQQSLLQQTSETPEQIKARLDRLAADPQALEAHNRNVLNRVIATTAPAGAHHELSQAVQAALAASTPAARASADPVTQVLQTEAAQREAADRTYTVLPGDTLWAIAARVYGDPHQFQRLFAANPRILASPDHIFPGQVLRVPS